MDLSKAKTKARVHRRLTRVGVLQAPEGFFLLSTQEKEEVCNGAGPKNFGWMVPDYIYGLKIKAAADIHDYCYWAGFDRKFADELFLKNMLALIAERGGRLENLRTVRANTYYWAVRGFGWLAYSPEIKYPEAA